MDLKQAIADLARPFAIISTSGAAAWATVTISYRVDGFENAALYMAAVYAGLAGLYGFKAWENQKATTATAEVEKVRATANPPPAQALAPAPPEERSLEDPA